MGDLSVAFSALDTGTPPAPDSTHQRWCERLTAIDEDLTDVAFTRYVWRAEEALLKDHADMPASDIFHVRARNYGIAQAIAIRRQADDKGHSITLANLLTDIAEHAGIMTVERYVGRAPWGTQWIAQEEFSRWANSAGTHLDSQIVERDFAAVLASAHKTRLYVNRHIAHLDPHRDRYEAPTFADLDTVTDLLFDTFSRYSVLLTGADRAVIAPVPQYDLLAPYDRPWRSGSRWRRPA